MKHTYLLALFFIVSSMGYAQTAAFRIEGALCDSTDIQFIDESSGNIMSWSWDFDGDNIEDSDKADAVFMYKTPGIYTVTLKVITSAGLDSTQQTVTINQRPVPNFVADTTNYSSYSRFFLAEESDANNGTITNFYWDFDDGNTLQKDTAIVYHKYKNEGTYNVKLVITDAAGCKDSIAKPVLIQDLFVVPNVFTPNGDGKNDKFVIYSNGETLFSIDIFSRWGNLIFRRENIQEIVWDGHLTNGILVHPGTYFYVISVENQGKAYEPLQGFVTIFY